MAGKLSKITWHIDADVKFVFYVDEFNYIKRAQILNRSGWGYLDLKNRSVGKIKANDFMELYSTYCLPNNAWWSLKLSRHVV
jgi:hypothetical protein